MIQFAWYDAVGSTGVATLILTYTLLQTGKIKGGDLSYSVLNAVGAGLILFSLIYSFNFSAFIVESLWVLISLYGIGRYFLVRKS